MSAVQQLSRIRLISRDPEQLAEFYEAAFGFARSDEKSATEPAFAALMCIPGATARIITLQLGDQKIELAGIHPRGGDYPESVAGWSPLFQHCAIVVSDMTKAYARLSAQAAWVAISKDGPQLLPPASGGVTAFKFRDPEGHPLELLAFAPGAVPERWQSHSSSGCLGIDHSAISITDTLRSIAFYERFGLRRIGGSLNVGSAQGELDDVAGARVEVTALAPAAHSTPHVELLCYRGGFDRNSATPSTNDIAATCLVFSVDNADALQALASQNRDARLSGPVRLADGTLRGLFRDPDGHLLCLKAPL
ncbi:MAG TPA: VOC family protein [Humisphaera sp.]|nr:VOC family protein [Humisphaera sp.]